jgi:adenylate cyclase
MTESIEISRQQHYSVLVAEAHIFRGWAYAMQGEIELGLAELRQGMDEWNALGNVLNQSHHQILLAEVYLAAHDPTAALASAERAIAASRVEGYLEPEAHRLRGEALLKLGAPAAHAEESFQQALTVARRQQACSLELRASMSLARLWQSQGKHAEAHELLSAIYGWFSEGFDTPDLIEAKALLAALAREYDRQATAISGGLDQMCYNCG